MNPEPVTGAALITEAICALDGGFNGMNSQLQLGITPQGDGTILYTLTDVDTLTVDSFTVTITPAT